MTESAQLHKFDRLNKIINMDLFVNTTSPSFISSTLLTMNTSLKQQQNATDGGSSSNDTSQLTQMQIILYILMAIIGTFGNTLTITVLLKPKFRKRRSSILLLNLAICDALIAALCIPLDVVYFANGKWMYGKQLCYVIPPFQTSMPIVSSWTFMFMMLERNSLFVKSIRGQMRRKSIRILAFAPWIISVALVIPYGVRLEAQEEKGIVACKEIWAEKLGRQVYTVVLSVTEFLVPMLIITAFVIRICINLARQSSQLKRNSLGLNEAKRELRLQQNRNITKMFIVMIAVYASLKLPNNIFWQWSEFGGGSDPDKKHKIWTFVALAAYSTSMVNPIVLAAMSAEFRSEFLNIIKCKSCRNSDNETLCRVFKSQNRDQDSTEVVSSSRGLSRYYVTNDIEMKSIMRHSKPRTESQHADLGPEKRLLKTEFQLANR